jgi:hypothetical protein
LKRPGFGLALDFPLRQLTPMMIPGPKIFTQGESRDVE